MSLFLSRFAGILYKANPEKAYPEPSEKAESMLEFTIIIKQIVFEGADFKYDNSVFKF